MISRLLKSLERGIAVMRSNNRLLFVAILIFVFPLLFIYITQGFYSTAYDNIQTSEKRRVGMFQDSLAAQISTNVDPAALNAAIGSVVDQNPDITEVRIVEMTPDGLRVNFSLVETDIGTFEKNEEFYDRARLVSDKNSFINEFTLDGARTWQAIRTAESSDGTTYFILSEHSFSKIDSVMAKRRQQSYLGLNAIFIFLIGLAGWFAKQTDWKKKHNSLKTQMEDRDLFTNMIAHEFRTPLTAIKGYASFLSDSQSITKEEKHYAENIGLATARLLALVNDFLEVARIQSGKMSLEKQETNLNVVVTGVIETLNDAAKEKGLALTFQPTETPTLLVTDAKRLHQVIQNLVSNSIKYTAAGTVEISLEENPLEVSIRVKDTGMGISADDQKKLFAPFSRVGGVEKTNISGTGLGMWITKQLVDLLGGTIAIESIKNVGTHVVVTFKR